MKKKEAVEEEKKRCVRCREEIIPVKNFLVCQNEHCARYGLASNIYKDKEYETIELKGKK